MKIKTTHGGARQGAGRNPSGRATRTLTFRIPEEDLQQLEELGVLNFSKFYVEAGNKALRKLIKKRSL